MPKRNITRDSHYVSQATLRRWSDEGGNVYGYRILVSHPAVPEWTLRSIRGLAYQRDLYTRFTGNSETDQFEQWITGEYEEPGLKVVDKVVTKARLTPSDWRALARFFAAQDVRTPLNFLELKERWGEEMPRILEETLQEAIKKLETARDQGYRLEVTGKPTVFDESFRINIEQPSDPTSDKAALRTEVLIGRGLWVASMRHVLTGKAASTLCDHRWSIVGPHGDEEWLLTDHPVLRLNYYGKGSYDFRGGWAKPGTELIMPLSPRHLLYVKVGEKAPNRFTFSREQTRLVQRFLAERALRWIFARSPKPWVAKVRPRVVDAAMFTAEEEQWKRWNEEHREAELPESPRVESKDKDKDDV